MDEPTFRARVQATIRVLRPRCRSRHVEPDSARPERCLRGVWHRGDHSSWASTWRRESGLVRRVAARLEQAIALVRWLTDSPTRARRRAERRARRADKQALLRSWGHGHEHPER
jgi:hypothetical protein